MKERSEFYIAERTRMLAAIAWRALIQASPTANPDALACKAIDLAKAFYKVEEALFNADPGSKAEEKEKTDG